jgi:hypothetical protein
MMGPKSDITGDLSLLEEANNLNAKGYETFNNAGWLGGTLMGFEDVALPGAMATLDMLRYTPKFMDEIIQSGMKLPMNSQLGAFGSKVDDAASVADDVGKGSGSLLKPATPSFKRNAPPFQQAVDFYKAHGIDVPVSELTSAQKSQLTRYGSSLSNPAVRRRESLILGDQQTSMAINMPNERRIITPSDMQGSVLVPVVGDQSLTGGVLTNINGVPLSRSVKVQGGPHYGLERLGSGYGWASMEGAARGKQNNIINASESTGLNPIGVYSAMADDSINFSTPVAESMIAQIDALGIPKSEIAKLNTAIRDQRIKNPNTGKMEKPFKHFVGVDAPDVYDQILGQGGYPKEASGKLRKGVIAEMSKAEWRNKGFPVYGDVQTAINTPELSGVNVGDSGFSMFTGNPSSGLLDSPDHLTYNKGIPGDYKGGLESPVPPEVMFPDVFDALSKKTNRSGILFPRDQQVGSLRSAKLQQIADQKWVDSVSRYLEQHRNPY